MASFGIAVIVRMQLLGAIWVLAQGKGYQQYEVVEENA
jgi:hypothetical protein